MIRHFFLNSIRSYNFKYKGDYGQPVLCFDSKPSWRHKVFPYYKAGRKRDDTVDWDAFYGIIDKLSEEFKENLPYPVIKVQYCEGDDIIATICESVAMKERVLIVSSDKDYVALQRFPNVDQFSHLTKEFIKEPHPLRFLKEKIIRGEPKQGDSIPNILSPENAFVAGIRQKPIYEKDLNVWLNEEPEKFCDDKMLRRFKQNEMLIDLTMTPSTLKKKILEQYTCAKPSSKAKLLRYMEDNRMFLLIDTIQEF